MPCPTTHLEVLDAVIARLLTRIPTLNPSTCFFSTNPQPSIWRNGNLFVTVAPQGGTFDQAEFNGMGRAGIVEQTGVIVTCWSAIKLDSTERDLYALRDPDRGLLGWKLKLLDALAGHKLLGLDGQELLTSYLRPTMTQYPQTAGDDGKFSGISIEFATDFNWRLSPE